MTQDRQKTHGTYKSVTHHLINRFVQQRWSHIFIQNSTLHKDKHQHKQPA